MTILPKQPQLLITTLAYKMKIKVLNLRTADLGRGLTRGIAQALRVDQSEMEHALIIVSHRKLPSMVLLPRVLGR